jgi:hypothetical protein
MGRLTFETRRCYKRIYPFRDQQQQSYEHNPVFSHPSNARCWQPRSHCDGLF